MKIEKESIVLKIMHAGVHLFSTLFQTFVAQSVGCAAVVYYTRKEPPLMPSPIEAILAHNRQFVAEGRYAPYACTQRPRLKTAILTCMDTRLTELLPAALGSITATSR